MLKKVLNQSISLKEHISEKEYKEIGELQAHCSLQDKTNLKLELDYRINVVTSYEIGLKNINEFLYYVEEVLVAYLNISSFGANIAEINGMTHPDFRRKGIFKKLFNLAIEECQKRNFNKVLLLSDGKSTSGIEFIKAVNGSYDFSEYRMKWNNKTTWENIKPIGLRKADKLDGKEIGRQNAIFFNDSEACESFPEEEEELNKITYMVELEGKTIGKVKVNFNNSAFIGGFGILPNFRGRGFGKAALTETLRLINKKSINEIELDVECKNNTALNLYKSCGFEQKSVMDYYKYIIS
ncbi:MAG: GNAT family N-acetyltransferase [Clostridiaceae bacterium]|nr:GNAT family N-acetyltransferase [Clostridiaceae bacterium]